MAGLVRSIGSKEDEILTFFPDVVLIDHAKKNRPEKEYHGTLKLSKLLPELQP